MSTWKQIINRLYIEIAIFILLDHSYHISIFV